MPDHRRIPLAVLAAVFIAEGLRSGMGVEFTCPGCRKERVLIYFENPLDNGDGHDDAVYHRVGDTLETLTVIPEIDHRGEGHWLGVIIDGACETMEAACALP